MIFNKIITNPPFRTFSLKKKISSQMILSHCKDYVVLATFRYCNNILGNVEYIEPEEWEEICSSLGIAWSGNTYKEERPKFLEAEVLTSPPKERGYVAVGCRPNVWHVKRTSEYKNLDRILLDAYSPETYIVSESSAKYSTKKKLTVGETKHIVCYKVSEQLLRKHWDQIFTDTNKWSSAMKIECILIRKEFVNEV